MTARDECLSVFIHSPMTSAEQKMQIWSHTVEKALNRTIQMQHFCDPLNFPQKNLPPRFRGRCQPPKFEKKSIFRSVKSDPTNSYSPKGEPTSLKTCQKVRQTRRLASLFRQVNRKLLRHQSWEQIPTVEQQSLQQEWSRIRQAQGFGHSWEGGF